MIGGHETPRLRDVLFGTTATHLLQQLDAPLLAVRGDAGTPYRRLLIALEGDEEESLLQAASAIAKPSEIFVVHATGSQLEIVSGDADLAEADEDVQTRRVREALAASGLALADVHVHTVCRDGEPLDLIGRSWAEARPDLLVMGTHGRSGIGRMLHGSRADAALIGYPADILVMRSRSPA